MLDDETSASPFLGVLADLLCDSCCRYIICFIHQRRLALSGENTVLFAIDSRRGLTVRHTSPHTQLAPSNSINSTRIRYGLYLGRILWYGSFGPSAFCFSSETLITRSLNLSHRLVRQATVAVWWCSLVWDNSSLYDPYWCRIFSSLGV